MSDTDGVSTVKNQGYDKGGGDDDCVREANKGTLSDKDIMPVMINAKPNRVGEDGHPNMKEEDKDTSTKGGSSGKTQGYVKGDGKDPNVDNSNRGAGSGHDVSVVVFGLDPEVEAGHPNMKEEVKDDVAGDDIKCHVKYRSDELILFDLFPFAYVYLTQKSLFPYLSIFFTSPSSSFLVF